MKNQHGFRAMVKEKPWRSQMVWNSLLGVVLSHNLKIILMKRSPSPIWRTKCIPKEVCLCFGRSYEEGQIHRFKAKIHLLVSRNISRLGATFLRKKVDSSRPRELRVVIKRSKESWKNGPEIFRSNKEANEVVLWAISLLKAYLQRRFK